jgi:hypothetical protein
MSKHQYAGLSNNWRLGLQHFLELGKDANNRGNIGLVLWVCRDWPCVSPEKK